MNFQPLSFLTRGLPSHHEADGRHTLRRSTIENRWLFVVTAIVLGMAVGVWWNFRTFRSTIRDSEQNTVGARAQNTVSDEKLGQAVSAGEERKRSFESIRHGGGDIVPDPSI